MPSFSPLRFCAFSYLFTIFWTLLGILPSYAQSEKQEPDIPSLPIDPQVRYGKLDNGLVYILRQNASTEKGKANFYLVVKSGSLQESEGENGLAHFVEKMSLHGSLHYPSDRMSSFLERHGILPGEKLVSQVFYDHTTYKISHAPTVDNQVVDSILLVLKDWASGLTFTPHAVEETRARLVKGWNAQVTTQKKLHDRVIREVLPKGHLYTVRPPEGSKEDIANVTPEKAIEYYRKWYRPELEAIIIVGDIDLDKVEAKITDRMRTIRGSNTSPEYKQTYIPEFEYPKAVVITSPAVDRSTLSISWVSKSLPADVASSAASLLKGYYIKLITSMLNERLEDLSYLPVPPVEKAEIRSEPFLGIASNEDALTLDARLITGGDYSQALKALVTEVKRAVEHGFTQAEFELAKERISKEYRLQYASLRNASNSHFADEYAKFFISGGYITGLELEQKLVDRIAEQVDLKGVNNNIQSIISGPNSAIILTLPDNGSRFLIPSDALLGQMYHSNFDRTSTLYRAPLVPDSLLTSKTLSKGYLVSEVQDEKNGVTKWKLSNGATLYYKPTSDTPGEVIIKAVSRGGIETVDAQASPEVVRFINSGTLSQFSYGGWSALQLRKFADRNLISLDTKILSGENQIVGRCPNESFEKLLQLLYLRMSRPELADDDFNRIKKLALRHIYSLEANPTMDELLADSLIAAKFPNQKVYRASSHWSVERMNLDTYRSVFYNHFGNANGFDFIVVGDIDPSKLQTLAELYIASLPSNYDSQIDVDYSSQEFPKKSKFIKIESDRAYPYAANATMILGDAEWTYRNQLIYQLLSDVIRQRYARDQLSPKSATRDFEITSEVIRNSDQKGSALTYLFYTDPDNLESLTTSLLVQLKSLATSGVEEGELATAIRHLIDKYIGGAKSNNYWVEHLTDIYFRGYKESDDYLSTLQSIQPEELTEALQKLFDHHVMIQVQALSKGR